MMKRLIYILGVLLSLGMFCACSSDEDYDVHEGTLTIIEDSNLPEGSIISQDLAWLIVKDFVLKNELDYINVFVSNEIIQPNTITKAYSTTDVSPDFASWLFFIDDNPYGNWSHPCRYVYVSVLGGKYAIHENRWPPSTLSDFTSLVLMDPNNIGHIGSKK